MNQMYRKVYDLDVKLFNILGENGALQSLHAFADVSVKF